MRRVAVTGMGIISSIGNNIDDVRSALLAGQSGIVFEESYASRGFRSHVAGTVKCDYESLINRRHMRFLGPGSAYSYLACQEALESAELGPKDIAENPRAGLIMGSGGPSTSNLHESWKAHAKRNLTRAISPFMVPRVMSSSHSAALATFHRIHGVSYSLSSACSTSAHCIGNAMECIQLGKQDIMICGGGEELHWTLSSMFDAMGALSQNFNDQPASASRPYDTARDGFVIAGGAGVLILEEMDHAERRNAPILAELIGYGATSDGHDMVQPSGDGAIRCMRLALETCESPISYINTHGTSTPVGDIVELESIREVFGDKIPPISSTKGLTGHSLGGTGAQEAIYCLLMMKHNFISGSAHIENLDPKTKGFPIVQKTRTDVSHTAVMSNSFGFGGTNAVLVFQK